MFPGGPDVRAGSDGVRALLAALPRVLRAGIPPPVTGLSTVRSAHLLGILLAGDGEFYVQSTHLLLDE